MSGPSALVRTARDSGGAVLVFLAFVMPVMIGAGGLIIDVGNWLAHKRHLQVQADAGALAGAGKFRVPCNAAIDTAIKNEAAKYSSVEYAGPGYSPGPGYNPQTGGTPQTRLHSEINSLTFYNQTTPVDDTVRTGEPCPAKMLDVKLTETNLPWYLKLANVDYINAQARVEIRQKTIGGRGALPVGVPEVGPEKAKAMFVDESTGTVIASTPLIRTGTANGLAMWSNAAAPVSVTVDAAKIGVRIALSGSTSTSCGDPLVDCYGAGTSAAIAADTPGLVHIRGWSSTPAATATAPQPRDVDLLQGMCEDGGFTAIAAASPCTVNVNAIVDFGPTPPALASTRIRALRTGANVTTAVDLAAPATIDGVWTGGAIPITRGEGPASIELRWQTGCNTDRTKPCGNSGVVSGIFPGVQRSFAGDEAMTVSGPIKLLRLTEGAVPPANSFERCGTCSHDLVVTLGLKPGLQLAQSVSDPIVSLKVAGGGSQNQALDCDDNVSNLRDELALGCGPTYAVNDGAAPCPGGAQGLWNTAQPWKCVVISTGATVGQVGQGMNKRILGATNPSSCTAPNNWASFPDFPPGDPRIVSVFLTPFGAFNGSGGTTVPVTGFANFYVTGWHNGGCQGINAPAGKPDDPAGQGEIVGHYIKHIETLNNGGGGEEECDYDSLGSCVAVFTR